MMKVSVIVPVFNVAPYLRRGLDSLVNQTLREIEIICIDDKSTDDSLDILREYAGRDNRIKLIELPQNQGVAVARNAGMKIAAGEYIGFMDPDDYVDLDWFEKLYAGAVESGADITAGNIRMTEFNGRVKLYTDWLAQVAANKFKFSYVLWCAIYRADMVRENKLENPAGVITSQDTVFAIKCAVIANKIHAVPDTFYNYIRMPGSISSEFFAPDKVQAKIDAANLIIDFLNTRRELTQTEYTDSFASFFKFIYFSMFYRTTARESRMMLMRAAIGLYKKHKYRHNIEMTGWQMRGYLESEDADGLYSHIESYSRRGKIIIKLFNQIPFIRIKKYSNYTKVSVFGIPIAGIYPKPDTIRYNG
jgi:glycosyltransferase involved in cell wall biosynthesis